MSIIISKTTVFMALLLVAMIGTVLGSNSTSKSLCYSGELCDMIVTTLLNLTHISSGSNLYQLLTQDCTSKDSSYTGEWYCAKMEVRSIEQVRSDVTLCDSLFLQVYESFQPNAREPIITRGCATESECTSSSNAIYSNTEIVVREFFSQKSFLSLLSHAL